MQPTHVSASPETAPATGRSTGSEEEPRTAVDTADTTEPTSGPARRPATILRRPLQAARRVPRVIWWVTALHLTFLGAYSILLPTYRAPDEPLHVDLAHLFSEELRYPAWDERDTGPGIQRSLGWIRFGSRSQHLTADEAPPKGDRPAIEDLEDPAGESGINQLPQHPPLYYVLTGSAAWAAESLFGDPIGDFQFETWFYRLISIAFVAPLPLIIWRTSRLLGLPEPVGVAATLIPLAVPQYLHIASSVNNDSLQLLLIWLLTPVVIRLADGNLGPRLVVLAGALTGLGLLTKGFALIMPLWVAGALVVAWRRTGRAGLPRVVRAGALFGLVSLAVGGWWWVRNLVLYRHPLPSRYSEIAPPIPDAPTDSLEFVGTWAYRTTVRFWGSFGWFDVSIPGYVVALASAICLAALAVACCRRDVVAGTSPGNRLLLAAPFLLLVAVQFGKAFQSYLDSGRMPGLQGRYWFGALAGLAVMVALGLANVLRRHLQVLPLAVLGGVVVMQTVGVSTILGFYWGAPGSSLPDRLRAVVAWAPVPGELIGAVAVVGGIVAVAAGAQVAAMAFKPAERPLSPRQ
jgi:small subunit ribosomal protein S36